MKSFKSMAEVDYAEQQHDFAVALYLRTKGWKHTSDTPGSYWMWEREIDGRTLLVDQNTAALIQRHIEAEEAQTCDR